MARYIVESRQRRAEREAREKRHRVHDREIRKQRQKLIDLRREYITEKYGHHQSRADKRPMEDPELEIRRAELIEIHRRSIEEEEEDDGEAANGRFYVIEKLIDKRINSQGIEEYKVRWQNYPPADDTWEPRAELERNAQDMIDAFNNTTQPDIAKHCICKTAYTPGKGAMIECFTCKTWYHFSCLNINLYEANCYARYHCNQCREQNPELKCLVKPRKLYKLQGLARMKVDQSNGVVLESPPKK